LRYALIRKTIVERQFISSPTVDEMPRTADVVVIGGGPAGTAALWAIERAAPGTKTVLIERNSQIAAGASNASLENFRTAWPAQCLAAMMQRSLEVFLNADDYLGAGARDALNIKQQGYAYIAITEAQNAQLKADVEHLHSIGVPEAEYLDTQAVRDRFPWFGERILGVKYDPTAGWLDSHALIYRMAQAATASQILLDIAHTEILTDNDKVVGVATPNGNIATEHVIIATGALAREIGRSVGIEIPIVASPRQSFTTPWRHAAFPEDGPTIIGAPPGPHVRPEARDGAIFGWEYEWNNKHLRERNEPSRDHLVKPVYPVEPLKDERFPSITLYLLAGQFGHLETGGGFADGRYLRGIDHRVGYYVYRDHTIAHLPAGKDETIVPYISQRAILDTWPTVKGLHLSVAHVGHGIMSAPAAGEIMAAKVLGQPLPNPAFKDFGLDANYVDHDGGELSG
jgi:glycine/D-amino acid oxidase-like deaminating enzyme